MNGSAMSATGIGRTPSAMLPAKAPSVKFWANTAARTIVQSAPDDCTSRSARSAPSSPRPDSSTRRRTPASTAVRATLPTMSAAPAKPMSGL